MNRDDFRTTPPADVTAVNDGERWMVIFVRELPHAPEKVWQALTDPEELREWSPFDSDRDLGTLGDATLTMAAGRDDQSPSADEQSPATVRRAEAPRLLEYTWDTDVLRWELEPTPSGTRLTLRHTVQDRAWLARVSAGWHICLDVLDRALAGDPVGRIVAGDAKPWWEPLNEEYSRRLGVES